MEITVATKSERLYAYPQSSQIMCQTGFVGRLRGDFGGGREWYSTWEDGVAGLNNADFKSELNNTINLLRNGKDDTPPLLKNLSAMSNVCYKNDAACKHEDRNQYFFRINSDNYAYIARCNPIMGDYQFYVYCYKKQFLDEHIQKASAGIRFITSGYDEKFRIFDGDKVVLTSKDGTKNVFSCRYIDDYHVETDGGRNLYHICQLAEFIEKNGATISPYEEYHFAKVGGKELNAISKSGIDALSVRSDGQYIVMVAQSDKEKLNGILSQLNKSISL